MFKTEISDIGCHTELLESEQQTCRFARHNKTYAKIEHGNPRAIGQNQLLRHSHTYKINS
jgi:hypothetical protein